MLALHIDNSFNGIVSIAKKCKYTITQHLNYPTTKLFKLPSNRICNLGYCFSSSRVPQGFKNRSASMQVRENYSRLNAHWPQIRFMLWWVEFRASMPH
jgi:hypothetical protein